MKVGGRGWDIHGSEVDFNGSEDSVVEPRDLKYSLDIPVSCEIPRRLISAPSFEYGLISRSYALEISLICYPGNELFSRTISQRIPSRFYV